MSIQIYCGAKGSSSSTLKGFLKYKIYVKKTFQKKQKAHEPAWTKSIGGQLASDVRG